MLSRIMKLFALLLCTTSVSAFVPSARRLAIRPSALSFGLDPSHLVDVIQQFTASSSLMLSDAMDAASDVSSSAAAVVDTVSAAADAVTSAAVSTTVDAVTNSADAVDAAAKTTDYGWFGFLTIPIEGLLKLIHSMIAATGTPNSWGVSIIVLTLLIKLVTFPLTKTQLESTNKMQAMQPAIKEIQLKYQSNPEVMNQKIAEFYQVNEINPLAGCFPSLVQIPVFIGLYRAVLELAQQNQLNERFLFLPNLEGPTYGADPTSASDWILKGWVDGTPSLGWDDTIAFLILPAFLVVSQYVSMELMQPKSTDPAQQQSNAILKVLPLMIGWFSLSVPAALSVYWVTNNIVTTASSLWIRNSMPKTAPKPASTGVATTSAPSQSIFTPLREKPAGFGDSSTRVSSAGSDGVKPITAMDAEIVDEDDDYEDDDDEEEESSPTPSSEPKKKRRKIKKKKRI